jgi:hypothetical protein
MLYFLDTKIDALVFYSTQSNDRVTAFLQK